MSREQRLRTLAELAVTLGANVQPGQIVAVSSEVGKEAVTRAVAEAAYARGAVFVDVLTHDPYVKRERLLHAERESLAFVPSWYGARSIALGEQRAAQISVTGISAPNAFAGIDPTLLGLDLLPRVREGAVNLSGRLINWTVIPCPTSAWASIVHPDLAADDALNRLWDDIAYVCRLDEPDPVAAWRQRLDERRAIATRLTALALDAVHLIGPDTDLTVGLLPSSRWIASYDHTIDGIEHVPNLPTEEVFTGPDPNRVDGHVTATKPLVTSGTLISGIRMQFEHGRAVLIGGGTGIDVLQALTAHDSGAGRLGELALVDRQSRIGQLGTVFYDTLLDENAASHIALGRGYPTSAGDPGDIERLNASDIHIDFMVGSDDVSATGITRTGQRIPLLINGEWQI